MDPWEVCSYCQHTGESEVTWNSHCVFDCDGRIACHDIFTSFITRLDCWVERKSKHHCIRFVCVFHRPWVLLKLHGNACFCWEVAKISATASHASFLAIFPTRSFKAIPSLPVDFKRVTHSEQYSTLHCHTTDNANGGIVTIYSLLYFLI